MQPKFFLVSLLTLIFTFAGCNHNNQTDTEILILFMGSPATPKIAKRLEKLNVKYKILNGLVPASEILAVNPKAIIITGSPDSVMDHGSPRAPAEYFKLKIPILGLCYGMQMLAEQLGGKVKKCVRSEKAVVPVTFNGKCGLAPEGLKEMHVLMDHDDCVVEIPQGFHTDASSEITQHAMVCSHDKLFYLIQFHPERYDTVPESGVILDAFIKKVLNRP